MARKARAAKNPIGKAEKILKAPQVGKIKAIPPESPEARDEGPRLIPLGPEFDRHPHVPAGVPPMPTDGYISIADKAIRQWNRSAGEAAKQTRTDVAGAAEGPHKHKDGAA